MRASANRLGTFVSSFLCTASSPAHPTAIPTANPTLNPTANPTMPVLGSAGGGDGAGPAASAAPGLDLEELLRVVDAGSAEYVMAFQIKDATTMSTPRTSDLIWYPCRHPCRGCMQARVRRGDADPG